MTSQPSLILIAIGPIQDFIRQARRTRDLWYGSHLLSELSRCVARSVSADGGELVFPALKLASDELQPCYSPLRSGTGIPPLSVANKVMAVIPMGHDPAGIAGRARTALATFWRDDLGAKAKARCSGLIAANCDNVWTEQLDSVLEFVAVWAPLPGGQYDQVRRSLEQSLGGRKNLREFSAWTHDRIGAPKSSFDGGRVSVLQEGKQRPNKLVRRYRIGPNEQLDAVGLVKRAGGEATDIESENDLQFVPVSNIAVASWVDGAIGSLEQGEANPFGRLASLCRQIGIGRVNRDLPCVTHFKWDASVLYDDRLPSVLKELDVGSPETLKQIRGELKSLTKRFKSPSPYVACIVADGDGMGRAIDGLTRASDRANAPQHRHFEFSEMLASFASDARKIVEQDHCGSLVYAGGDDVLAFVPVATSLACADALRRAFEVTMKAACHDLAEHPTLSVGIGIGHTMEGMGDLLDLGRSAEKLAKGADLSRGKDRNALAIIIDKRSGGQRSFRAQWSEFNGKVVDRLIDDANLIGNELSSRKIYQLQTMLTRLPKSSDIVAADEQTWSNLLQSEFGLSLARSQVGQMQLKADPPDFGLGWPATGTPYEVVRAAASSWINRMIIAREIRQATPAI